MEQEGTATMPVIVPIADRLALWKETPPNSCVDRNK